MPAIDRPLSDCRYATFVHGIGGLDATDTEAAAAGLPPLDSIDQWAYVLDAVCCVNTCRRLIDLSLLQVPERKD